MEKLPAEVFNGILDQLDPRGREGPSPHSRRNPWALPQPYRPGHIDSRHHYAKLRLVCKRFNELAAAYLFRSIGLRFNAKSFRRLERLAENKKLSRHVRKFVYLMPYLYEQGIQDFETFRNDQTLGLSNKIRQIMFDEKDPYFYMNAWREQHDLTKDGYDLKVLTKAMKAFTSLQEVNLLAIMVHKDIVLRNLASSFDNWDFIDCKWVPACKHATETLFAALHDAASPVTALCSPTMSPQGLILLGPKMRQITRSTWSNLTYLEITLDERPDRSYLDTSGTILTGHSDALAGMFADTLQTAKNLTTLYIRFTPGLPVRIPLEDAFANVVWPKLRVLGIGSWLLRSDEILDIVQRHSNTLCGLRLCEIYLLDGDLWKDVIMGVKELPHLEWVGLQDISYQREYVRKQAYIETYSDTSSSNGSLDEEYGTDTDRLSTRSGGSNSSTTASHDHSILAPSAAGDEDVVYGTVFTHTGNGAHAHGNGAEPTPSIHSSTAYSASTPEGLFQEDPEWWDEDDSELEDLELEDDGQRVSQAQRRHWERWLVGKYLRQGRMIEYTRPL